MTGPQPVVVSDPRLDELVDGIVRLASGDLGARLKVSPARDSIDAVISGVNLLAEELQVMYQDLEDRVEERTAQLIAAQVELERMAMSDSLTGLANRARLSVRMDQEAAATEAGGQPPAVIFLDLDMFKTVNDNYGHVAGDAVLIEVAKRLATVAGEHGVAARLGGDEFALLLPEADEQRALEVAERALDALRPPVAAAGTEISILASIGVRYGAAGDSSEALMRDADTAMYIAKARGTGVVQVFDADLDHAIRGRMKTVAELRIALDADELIVHYQPIMELGTGRIIGAEALVRWLHPKRGLTYPDQFVGLAEESGLIADLGRWVIRATARQLAQWERNLSSDFGLRINLSATDMRQASLADYIASTLGEHGVPPHRLIVEITETVLMTGDPVSTANLRELSALGIGVEIDDFGTGYSSISYLRRLPADTVKMDRSLIEGIAADSGQRAFVAAVLQLIAAAGLTALAEGIETADQAQHLRSLGCRYGQGRYFSPPVAANRMGAMLAGGAVRQVHGRSARSDGGATRAGSCGPDDGQLY